MQVQLGIDGVASEAHQCLWCCLQTDRQLTLTKELKPKFKITGGMIGILINISRFETAIQSTPLRETPLRDLKAFYKVSSICFSTL